MKITLFTIREKHTNKLIYAEGVPHSECTSHFKIHPNYFSQNDIESMENSAWNLDYNNQYRFDEEIRHLENYDFDNIVFNPEEEYEFVDYFTLNKV